MTLTTYGTKVDLRDIPARDRPGLVFNTYRLLEAGQTMDLINDQDPLSLHQQLQESDPGGFRWDCTKLGASDWRVRIVRMSSAAQAGSCCGCNCSRA